MKKKPKPPLFDDEEDDDDDVHSFFPTPPSLPLSFRSASFPPAWLWRRRTVAWRRRRASVHTHSRNCKGERGKRAAAAASEQTERARGEGGEFTPSYGGAGGSGRGAKGTRRQEDGHAECLVHYHYTTGGFLILSYSSHSLLVFFSRTVTGTAAAGEKECNVPLPPQSEVPWQIHIRLSRHGHHLFLPRSQSQVRPPPTQLCDS